MENNIVSHEVKIIDRNFISISGVSKVNSFTSEEFIVDSVMGSIYISGEGMELVLLDNDNGLLKIKGKINGYNYIDKKKKNESFITKLFKWVDIYNYYVYSLILFLVFFILLYIILYLNF